MKADLIPDIRASVEKASLIAAGFKSRVRARWLWLHAPVLFKSNYTPLFQLVSTHTLHTILKNVCRGDGIKGGVGAVLFFDQISIYFMSEW